MELNYAYIWDGVKGAYIPMIAHGTFKGVRVDYLPIARSINQALVYLWALDFVEIVEPHPTRVYFSLSNSDKVGKGTRTQQRKAIAQLLEPECGPVEW